MALEAAETLAEKGIQVKVVNARFIKPLDTEYARSTFHEAGNRFLQWKKQLWQEDSEVQLLNMQHDVSSNVSISRIGIPDEFIEHGSVDKLFEEIDLTSGNVVRTMERAVKGFTRLKGKLYDKRSI